MGSSDLFNGYELVWETFNSTALWQVLWTVLPVWAFGALVGFLLPRPKWLSGGSRTALLFTPPGTGLRRLALAFHGAVILREVWYYFTCPGTFRRLVKATWDWMCGRGFRFEWPRPADSTSEDNLQTSSSTSAGKSWYVDETDLAFFKARAERDEPVEGASKWECILEKDIPNFVRYQAWRRTLPSGKTEYKSVTVCPDASAEEFMDMYFDDEFRPKWDTMITHHEVLEHGDYNSRQQVVRWIRCFPFAFLTDREYVIARRWFKEGRKMYGLTKAVNNHPRAPVTNLVKMDVFYSMWMSQNVECPWGSGKPASQTLLIHHEEFKITEHLARFAARHGMWGFVRKLSSTVPEYVAQRRTRCGSYEEDPQAFGAGFKPNPPGMQRSASSLSTASWFTESGSSGSGSSTSSMSSTSSECSDAIERLDEPRPRRRMRKLVALVVAGGLAVMLNKSAKTTHRSSKQHHRRHHDHHERHRHEDQADH